MREAISAALKESMKARDADRTGTLRLVVAAFKDRDIEARGAGKETATDDELKQLLAKMVKQRQESAAIYEENARPELAAKEKAEIAVIQEFLPKQLSDEEVSAAIDAAIAETGAASMKDMGKVMGALKAKYTGMIDFAAANGAIKAKLQG
ncbi:GatB/YqeY domain-containing protein [Chenggangzhangella methanolivorans]|uniref:GatB/YqeY domain-containing protein n=1 Tax=Chenggangzhangella methanolivorans TaxID=1437009 RepID=A0A9E6RCQ0_9HYPH|nr:GatB/YqeY domain-containing protein [Chenggangzhangella methanolivorans]QZO00879.1 GatB/YqeY domain-containing protein [Chenggangzhangella methanolivorans]